MELISNYVNLGKFIQDVYQYPYYIKINSLTVEPYAKDKRILISTLSLRLYAHTAPDEQEEDAAPLTSATTALPQ
jgi:Tfp pilus assembly protein PilO